MEVDWKMWRADIGQKPQFLRFKGPKFLVVRSEVFTAVKIQVEVFRVVTPCTDVSGD
jgi:hypothetical protein